jgi:hypothetical protein
MATAAITTSLPVVTTETPSGEWLSQHKLRRALERTSHCRALLQEYAEFGRTLCSESSAASYVKECREWDENYSTMFLECMKRVKEDLSSASSERAEATLKESSISLESAAPPV